MAISDPQAFSISIRHPLIHYFQLAAKVYRHGTKKKKKKVNTTNSKVKVLNMEEYFKKET
jgi:hypothetical protein